MILVVAPSLDAMRSAAAMSLALKDPFRVLPERKAILGALIAIVAMVCLKMNGAMRDEDDIQGRNDE